LLLFMLLMFQEAPMPLDELGLSHLFFATQKEDVVLFHGTKPGGVQIPLYLYSFKTKQVREIKDGRIKAMMPHLATDEDGFMLINIVGSVFLDKLNTDGSYRETIRLDGVIPPGERIKFVQSTPQGLWVNISRTDHIRLAVLDPAQKSLVTLADIPREEDHARLLFQLEGQTYRITEETGEIVRLNAAFQPDEVLVRGMDPVEKKRRSRSRYYGVLSAPIMGEGFVSLRHVRVRDAFGNLLEEPGPGAVLLTRRGVKNLDYRILGEHAGALLVFDPSEMTFSEMRKPDGLF